MNGVSDRDRPTDDFSDVVIEVSNRRRELVEKLTVALCAKNDSSAVIRALREFCESKIQPVDRRDALLSLLEFLDEIRADNTQPASTHVAIDVTITVAATIIFELVELLTGQSDLERYAISMYRADRDSADEMPKLTGKAGGNNSGKVRRMYRMSDMISAAREYNLMDEPTLKALAGSLEKKKVQMKWNETGDWLSRVNRLKKKNIVIIADAIRAIPDKKSPKHPR